MAGAVGVVLLALIVVGAGLLSWTSFRVAPAPRTMTMFNVAPPAAPPEPPQERPPGPEQQQKERARPDAERPRIEPPEIQIRSDNPMQVDARPVVDPGPPIRETTAPEAKPLPPAPQQSSARPTWEGLVLGALNRVKRYPREASFRRQQGVPYIRFVIDRRGKLISVRLERSSGVTALDAEALALPRRAQPLPRPPEEVKGDAIELVAPVEFFLR